MSFNSLSSVLEFVNLREKEPSQSSEYPSTLVFLRNFTIEGIEPFLKFHLYQSGLKSEIIFGAYDSPLQEVINNAYKRDHRDPDILVISLYFEALEPDYELSTWTVDNVWDRLFQLYEHIRHQTRSLVVLNTFLRPLFSDAGVNALKDLNSLSCKIIRLNERICDYVSRNATQFFVIDWEAIMMRLGTSCAVDKRFWYLGKAPFRPPFLDAYAKEIGKIGIALKGKTKKCLVLDCDNTLWGGVIGEDGLHGIQLDRNEYPGKAYYDFQKTVLHLHHRGVLIALCSRNNEEDVWSVFDDHPCCLLKRKHLAGYRINWNDKIKNLLDLSQELKFGLDSFVVVEDDEVQCGLISQFLPEVTVRQVPKKLYEYPSLLLSEGWFDTLNFCSEDIGRTEMYHAESLRERSVDLYRNIEDYLSSLELNTMIHEARQSEIPRIAQLTQKTNQFNLTTRRYSAAQIEQFIRDPRYKIFTLSVKDKFGDYGLTGVLMACKEEGGTRVDTFLLSCRVLGRSVEFAFLNECFTRLNIQWSPHFWVAEYIPTKKNGQCSKFWEGLGFSYENFGNGSKRYLARLDQIEFKQVPFIKVE